MSTGSSSNQTLTFLRRRFEEVGFHPRVMFGQNFLIDLNLLRVLLDTADLGPDDVVLEVGTGTGSLTAQMAKKAAEIVTVEIDRQIFQLASEELIDYPNVTMLLTDILKNKNKLNPEVLHAVEVKLAASPSRRFKLAANLPYNVATPLISNLLALDRPPEAMIVTIQREVAERMAAAPGHKDYSALSVWVQSQCEVEIARILPPSAFWPRPKVDSAFLKITFNPALRARIPDLAFFHEFVRSMFFHRRKYLRSELLSAYKGRFDKPRVDGILAAAGLAPTVRAEELDVTTFLRLCELVRKELAEPDQLPYD